MRHLSAILVILMGLVLSAPLSYGASDDTKKEQKSEQANDSKPILLLHVGELLAVPGQAPLTQQTIVVEGDKIKAVHAGYQTPEDIDFPDARLIDLKDKFVMPGLMDLHVHLTMTKDHDSKADDMALVGVVNARKTLMAGYTTVRDIGAWGNTIFKLRKKVQAGEIDGPRIFAAGQIIGVGSKDGGLECNGPESCRRTTRDLIKAGADWIKIYSSCSGSQLCSNENGAPVFFADEIEAVTQVAAKYGVKVAAHSHPRNSALFVLKYGVSSIEHGSFMDDKALRAMKKQGTYFVPTVSVHDMLEKLKADGKVEGKMLAHNDAFLAQHPDTILRAYKMGVQIATGSDAGVVPHGKNYREIERFVALGIPAAQALKMATVNGADLLGRSEDLGTLEQGKYADIIALDGNPLTQIENIEKVVFVMKSGKVFRRE
ncbi:amidohydrolase family protein [Paremcibacter congregatus]|uniref:amidohydrolase family protein n=1 Tax=Paremcibacter congregatus TaxID=2043170 RepID=UPI0030EEB4EF